MPPKHRRLPPPPPSYQRPERPTEAPRQGVLGGNRQGPAGTRPLKHGELDYEPLPPKDKGYRP